MDAEDKLSTIADIFNQFKFDAVMIGNAGAAINGAPVTTLDVDFLIEQTPENYRKIAAIAQHLNWTLYELKLSKDDNYMYRLFEPDGNFSIDLLFNIAGFDNTRSLRQKAHTVKFGANSLKVARLEDILKSKRAAAREKDLAVIPILEKTLNECKAQKRKAKAKDVGLSF